MQSFFLSQQCREDIDCILHCPVLRKTMILLWCCVVSMYGSGRMFVDVPSMIRTLDLFGSSMYGRMVSSGILGHLGFILWRPLPLWHSMSDACCPALCELCMLLVLPVPL